MQEEVNEKTVSLCITGGKVTVRSLKQAMMRFLSAMEKEKAERSRKQQQTKGPPDKEYHGKQSMKKLAQQNVQLSNIEITNNNIKAFEKVAKKYGIDFSLKRDKSVDPPRYFVFFKAIDLIIHNGRVGEVYNIGGHNEMKNIDIVKIICKELDKPESLITYVTDRKGHDMRYAIDPTKIHNELGWLPETKFVDGIKKTIQWYLDNREWWETIISGEYQNYYEEMYGNR